MKRFGLPSVCIGLLLLLLCLGTLDVLAINTDGFPAQAELIYPLPDGTALAVVSSDGEDTVVTGYNPDSGETLYTTPLGWLYDECFPVGDRLAFTHQEIQFDPGTNTFRYSLQILAVNLQSGIPSERVDLRDIQASVGRVAITETRIAVIDNGASHTVRLYTADGTPVTTLQTPWENLTIEGTDRETLFLSHSESDSLYTMEIGGDASSVRPPLPITGVSKPLILAKEGLLLTANGVYSYDPAAGTARPGLSLPVSLATLHSGRIFLLSGVSLYVADASDFTILFSSDTDADTLSLCVNGRGLWRLAAGTGGGQLRFLSNNELFPPEAEALSGDLYATPDRAALESLWKLASQGLPATGDALFSRRPSLAAPYDAGQLNTLTFEQTDGLLNLCRTLAGLPPLDADTAGSAAAQYGAALLSANPTVLLNGRRPDGMSESFYDSGLHALQDASAFFLSADYPLNGLIPSLFYATNAEFHARLLHPSASAFRLGMAPSGEDSVTALLSVDVDPGRGYARQFYSWPSHGAFPLEFARPLSDWLVMLNPDSLRVREEALAVTLTDKTGESWPSGVTLQKDTLFIAPPDDLREGDAYDVFIEGLERPNGTPVTLSLRFEFLRLIRVFPENITLYREDSTPLGTHLSPITTDLTLTVGERFTLVCYLLPKNTTETDLSITSNRPGVLRVEKDGTVTALNAGEALLTIEAAGGLTANVPVTVSEKSVPPDPPPGPAPSGGIESDVYKIDRAAGFIYNLEPSTTVAQFKKNLRYTGVISVRRPDGNTAPSAVGTGCIVELTREGQVVERLTALVFGDVTGEGNVNTRDLQTLRNHLLRKTLLEDAFLRAADTNHDSRISSLDILIITRYHLYRENVPKTDILRG